MAIYVKYGSISGDATHEKYKGAQGWWQAGSCNFSVSRNIQAPVGSTQDRIASHAMVSEIMVSKAQNTASAAFFKEATVGKGVDAFIDFLQDGDDHGQPYLQLKLEKAMIGHYNTGGSGSGRPQETLSFSFTKLEVKTTEYKDDGSLVTTKSHTYDVSTGKTS